MTATDQDKLDSLLDDFFAALDETDLDTARRLVREAEAIAPRATSVLHARAQLAWIDEDTAGAKTLYEAIIAEDAGDADAWHALGLLADDAEDEAAMVKAFLEVHRLDSEADAAEPMVTAEDEALIARVARETLDHVPDPFRGRLGNVAVVLAPRPERSMVEQGFDPRALGLFEGNDDEAAHGASPAPGPTRVVLFTSNLVMTFAGDGDQEMLAEEVEVTVLHELGHFFGLDEDEVEELGLA